MKWMKEIICLLILMLALVACGEGKENPVDASTESQGVAANDKGNEEKSAMKEAAVKDDKVKRAENERVEESNDLSEREEQIIKELTEIGAEKYGVTLEAYIETLKGQGLTPYTAQKQLADTMGISLEELHAYETANRTRMSDEQKENNANLADALEEASLVGLTGADEATALGVLGMKINESGEIIPLEGDIDALFSYRVKEMVSIYDDEHSYVVEYFSDGSVDEALAYFDELLMHTEEYFLLAQDMNVGGYVTGRVNGMLVTVAIEPLDEGLNVIFYVDKTTKEMGE